MGCWDRTRRVFATVMMTTSLPGHVHAAPGARREPDRCGNRARLAAPVAAAPVVWMVPQRAASPIPVLVTSPRAGNDGKRESRELPVQRGNAAAPPARHGVAGSHQK